MYAKTAVAFTTFLAVAQAVKVTSPAKGDDWDLSETNTIKWESVSSDPKKVEIVISNQSGFPEVKETIATVNTADGKYELKGLKLSAGDSYRINLESVDKENTGILAQSEAFSFEEGDSDDSSSTASATASATKTSSGSASASATGTSSGSATGTASVTATASGLTTVTTGTATATASGTAASNASASGTASGTATGSAASGTSTSAPSSASAVKSTFAIFGSVALAAYMLF